MGEPTSLFDGRMFKNPEATHVGTKHVGEHVGHMSNVVHQREDFADLCRAKEENSKVAARIEEARANQANKDNMVFFPGSVAVKIRTGIYLGTPVLAGSECDCKKHCGVNRLGKIKTPSMTWPVGGGPKRWPPLTSSPIPMLPA